MPKAVLFMALHFALLLTYIHWKAIDEPSLQEKMQQHQIFLGGEAPNPYQYRILLHLICELCLKAAAPVLEEELAFLLTQLGFTFLTTFAALCFFYLYLRSWFAPQTALLGMVVLAAIHPLTYFNYHYQPSSSLALLVFIVSMWAMDQKCWGCLLIWMIVGMLNRFDTAVFLMILLVLVSEQWNERRFLLFLWLCGVLLLSTVGGLWFYYGPRPAVHSVSFHLSYNLTTIGTGLLILLYGPFWIWPLKGLTEAPRFLRRAFWLVPFYILLHFFAAKVNEVRLFLPLATILIPLSLPLVERGLRDDRNKS